MDKVLVIWEIPKDDGACSFTSRDSDLTVEQVLMRLELYKMWLLNKVVKKW